MTDVIKKVLKILYRPTISLNVQKKLMIQVKKEGIILRKEGLDFEDESVLNPAALRKVTLLT